jgi:triacylglycerol esterase/lipase EstA (alpha/beta hydrolase family)
MKRLIVLATGLNGSPQKWNSLLKRLHEEEEFMGSDWLVFDHYGFWNFRVFSNFFTQSIETLSLELKARIEQHWIAALSSGKPYEDVICIGHSVGGLMVRQAYLIASGAYPKTGKSEIRWAEKVSRFILLASINRGFEPSFAWDSLTFWLKLIISIAIVYFAYTFAKTG